MSVDWSTYDPYGEVAPTAEPVKSAAVVDGSASTPAVDWSTFDPFSTEKEKTEEKVSIIQQAKYGWDKAMNLGESVSVLLDMYATPMGRLQWDEMGLRYESPDEMYGADYEERTPEELRQMYMTTRSEWLGKKYPVLSNKDEQSAVSSTAEFMGHLISPETLIPFGGGRALSAGAQMGALGGSMVAAEELVKTGEVDPGKVALGTALGFVGGAGVQHVMNVLREMPGQAANRLVTAVEKNFARHTEEGITDPAEAWRRAVDDAGLTEETVLDVVNQAGRRVVLKKPAPDAPKLSNTQVADELEKSLLGRASGALGGVADYIGKGLDPWIGVVSTRLGLKSVAIRERVRRFEFDTHTKTLNTARALKPFTQALARLPAGVEAKLMLANRAGDHDQVLRLIEATGDDVLIKEFPRVRKFLDAAADSQDAVGLGVKRVENYMPMVVKDYEGLATHLGVSSDEIKRAFKEAAEKQGSELTDIDKAAILNKFVSGQHEAPIHLGGTAHNKSRKIDNVTEDMLPYYHTWSESLHRYFDHTIHSVEKRKLFGKVPKEYDPSNNNDLSRSIGWMLSDDVAKGRLNTQDAVEVSDLLKARFGPGERAANNGLRSMKQVFQSMLLANPVSAATQLGDVGIAAFRNGMFRTSLQVAKALTRNNELSMEDVGLSQAIHEFTDEGKAADFLRWSLKWSGFSSVDRLGKTTIINGSLSKYRKWATTPEGVAKIHKRYGQSFTPKEFGQVIKDLKARKNTSDVKYLLASDVADIQPIYLSELPQKFLEVPNGRLFYTLKSFTIKQLDIARRDIYHEMRKGNVATAGVNLARFGMLFTAANMGADQVKQWMLGREVPIEDMVVSNLWKVGATSDYNVEQFKQGKYGSMIASMTALPFFGIADTAGRDLMSAGQNFNSLQYVPLTGKIMYNWWGGGLEKWEDKQPKFYEREKK